MKARFGLGLLALAFTLSLASCGGAPKPEQIKKDLVGQQTFSHYKWGSGGETFVFEQDRISEAKVLGTKSTKGGMEVLARVTASTSAGVAISADFILYYDKFSNGWRLNSLQPSLGGTGKSFDLRVY